MKNQKIAIIVLGKRNAGKSSTWYELFGKVIRSGWKKLKINGKETNILVKNSSPEESNIEIGAYIKTFVINSSHEESRKFFDDYFHEHNLPKILFCSVQYVEHGIKTITWLQKRGYYLYIQWLNHGWLDKKEYADHLGFEERFRTSGHFTKRSGKEKAKRVAEIKSFLKDRLLNATN